MCKDCIFLLQSEVRWKKNVSGPVQNMIYDLHETYKQMPSKKRNSVPFVAVVLDGHYYYQTAFTCTMYMINRLVYIESNELQPTGIWRIGKAASGPYHASYLNQIIEWLKGIFCIIFIQNILFSCPTRIDWKRFLFLLVGILRFIVGIFCICW